MSAPFANPATSGQIIPRTEAVIKIWDKASDRERVVLGQMHQHYEHEVRRLVYATIADHWASYVREVMPADAGLLQLQETRRAFYAAAHAMLQTMLHVVAAEEDDDKGVAILEAMHEECRAFVLAIARGQA